MINVVVRERAGAFAEDKDIAASIREKELKPQLQAGRRVRIDFAGVTGATQSFVHAMLSELIRAIGPEVLDRLEFKSCSPAVRAIIGIVCDYSQSREDDLSGPAAAQHPLAPGGRRPGDLAGLRARRRARRG